MKNFLAKWKTAKEEIDDMNSKMEEYIENIKETRDAFIRKTDEILITDLKKIEKLKEKMNCLSDENNLEELDKTINEILAISKDDIGKRAQEELYFDSFENVTEK